MSGARRSLRRRRAPVLSAADAGSPDGRPPRFPRLPKEVRRTSTMLSREELQLLYWLARDYNSEEGTIVDAGCFLGGSTVALAAGVRDGGHAESTVHTYDQFVADWWTRSYGFPEVESLRDGESFRDAFDRNIAGFEGLVSVTEGDIRENGWTGEPIEIAFLDILKEWSINDYVVAEFFPAFIPGRTVLVQQDLVHEFCPWIAVTMGRFESHFELIDLYENASAVYRYVRPLPAELTSSPTAELEPEETLGFFDRAVAPIGGELGGVMECARAWLVWELHGLDAGLASLGEVRAHHGRNDRLRPRIDATEAGMRSAEENRPT